MQYVAVMKTHASTRHRRRLHGIIRGGRLVDLQVEWLILRRRMFEQ